ncbi:hypothetical protein QVD17_31704 [Tagetes erecta]|uniref:Protein PHYTOCHROME KINASE SUBSTRATE 1-like n=1 Tax=Tagetes erecta TaxID=13708 RepID=A0AAD8K7I3_TARER|nr:hypothetical protein QVD17_31704 [Tagetes erecta]
MIASDDSSTKERFKAKHDDEIGVFGAEKYFKGVTDEDILRTSYNGVHYHQNPTQVHEKPCLLTKSKTVSSVRSESSWNSRRGLLVSNGSNQSKKISFKSLLASLAGCSCNDKGSVKIAEVKQPVKWGDFGTKKTKLLSSRSWADEDVNIRRPVLNPKMVDANPKPETIDDTGSEASSDLFEIESFSTNKNNLFLARQAIENNMYAPSEASVNWSVVTANDSDFSAPQDLLASRNAKGLGALSRCTSLKVVRVSGGEHGTIMGSNKATVIVSAGQQEWCHRLDSVTPIAKIQADNKLRGAGSDLRGCQTGVCVERSVPRIHSTHPEFNK